ncbi:MAG: hypothetical protein R3A13_11485 [Bdellovibrionota bacterium]
MKTEQLQIRVSAEQKARIKALAKQAGMSVSEWVLGEVLSAEASEFEDLVGSIPYDPVYAFAALNEFLFALSKSKFSEVTHNKPRIKLSEFEINYLCGMLETAAEQKGVRVPDWLGDVEPLSVPYFGSSLENLKLHLLLNSPPAFKSRNIFIDSSVGDRV